MTPLGKALELPLVPSVFGFDPRFQFVHEDDVVRAILYRPRQSRCRASTTWPATGSCRGARWRRSPASAPSRCHRSAPSWLRRRCAGSGVDLPPELLDLLRYGRGVDNRRLIKAGFDYDHTSAGTVQAFVEALRLRRTVGRPTPSTATSGTSSISSATPLPSCATTPDRRQTRAARRCPSRTAEQGDRGRGEDCDDHRAPGERPCDEPGGAVSRAGRRRRCRGPRSARRRP